jgi:chorismate synthase
MNTFGTRFRLTTFGESHGPAIGGVVDGMPAGIAIDRRFIDSEMARRRPGHHALTSARKEDDEVEFLSGIYEGVSTGAPIGFIIRNNDCRSADYDKLKNLYRPGHADYTYTMKYGIRDPRGGGRASARETACRVVAGALAKLYLKSFGISIHAELVQVGNETDKVRMEALIEEVRADGDSVGGIVSCTISHCPAGVGEPIYGKLHALLGSAMLSINACHGFDYGIGFEGVGMRGSEQNDLFVCNDEGVVSTLTNHSGGIQGGISNGQPICFRALFKPTPTLLREQQTIDSDGQSRKITVEGRHDPCVAVRAVPVVEAMAAIVMADCLLISYGQRTKSL